MRFNKKEARLKRIRRFRARCKKQDVSRLVVHRTNQNIYAQIISVTNGDSVVKACASTLDKSFSKAKGTKSEKAELIGKIIAEKAKKQGIEKVAFDRSGFKYHGRIKALADSARKEGLDF